MVKFLSHKSPREQPDVVQSTSISLRAGDTRVLLCRLIHHSRLWASGLTSLTPVFSVEGETRTRYFPKISTKDLCACVRSHSSRVQLFATLCTVACQAPLPMEFSRQEYQSGLPCLPPGDLPNPGIEHVAPAAPALQDDSLPLSHGGSPPVVLPQTAEPPKNFSTKVVFFSFPGSQSRGCPNQPYFVIENIIRLLCFLQLENVCSPVTITWETYKSFAVSVNYTVLFLKYNCRTIMYLKKANFS